MTTKSKKIKIDIMGKKYKVDEEINNTLKALSEALHSHEVALLTWTHKDYNNTEKNDLKGFRDSLNEYCLGIPEAENILKRMVELDKQYLDDAEKRKEPISAEEFYKKEEEKGKNNTKEEKGAKE